MGRGPLNRYGGEKISYDSSLGTAPSLPLPPTSTRPSGRSNATEWYKRGICSLASVDHVSLVGDHDSAAVTALASFVPSAVVSPPVASTVPSGRVVRFRKARGFAMGETCRHEGDDAVMSRPTCPATTAGPVCCRPTRCRP